MALFSNIFNDLENKFGLPPLLSYLPPLLQIDDDNEYGCELLATPPKDVIENFYSAANQKEINNSCSDFYSVSESVDCFPVQQDDIDFALIAQTNKIFSKNVVQNELPQLQPLQEYAIDKTATRGEDTILVGEETPDQTVVREEVPEERDEEIVNVENNGTKNTKSDNKKMMKEKAAEKHPMLLPCACKSSCFLHLNEEQREVIHNSYWERSYDEQNQWLLSQVKGADKQRSRKRANDDTTLQKKKRKERVVLSYSLPNEHGRNILVCQKMLLNTLGFTSNQKLVTLLNKAGDHEMFTPPDQRGRSEAANKKSPEIYKAVKDHIFSYHPQISHYRRKHAPCRLYLSPEINMTMMFQDFAEKYPNEISLEYYRKLVREHNISFCKLGEEECEHCLHFNIHEHDEDEDLFTTVGEFTYLKDCETCDEHQSHMEKAKKLRQEYRDDREKNLNNGERCFATDMQKVVMLPFMTGVKSCIFTKRLTAYHLTFAPLGGRKYITEKPTGVIWHQELSGRNDEDLASAYIKFIQCPNYRDLKEIIFWVDNCSAQNKNWTLYTAFVYYLYNPSVSLNSITLKYFEPGHTFMAADSFHHQIESEMRARKCLYDFDDFVSVINKKGMALCLESNDFTFYESKMSSAKYTNHPLLDEVTVAHFKKEDTKLYWKSDIDEENFKCGEFLQKKIIKSLKEKSGMDTFPQSRKSNKGICKKRKDGITRILCPMMDRNRRKFWESLQVIDDEIENSDSDE